VPTGEILSLSKDLSKFVAAGPVSRILPGCQRQLIVPSGLRCKSLMDANFETVSKVLAVPSNPYGTPQTGR